MATKRKTEERAHESGGTKLSLPRSFVDFLLLGPADDRRQLQDSPILGDVWLAYAANPNATQDLLITPYKGVPAARVAKLIHGCVHEGQSAPLPSRKIAYLQGIVAARLHFHEVLRFIVPATQWWHEREVLEALRKDRYRRDLPQLVGSLVCAATRAQGSAETQPQDDNYLPLDRYVVLAALILFARERSMPGDPQKAGEVERFLAAMPVAELVAPITALFGSMLDDPMPTRELIWQVSLNRRATPALERSVPAVKADAARSLFKVKCDRIAWAVVDSGIDVDHEAFQDEHGMSRVVSVFDFSRIREIISIENKDDAVASERANELLAARSFSRGAAKSRLKRLAADAEAQRAVDWDLVERFVRVDKPSKPQAPHGTHVAGILGGRCPAGAPDSTKAEGMCPDIMLYDFRVLSKSIEDTEFAIIAALQFIRYLNERNNHVVIHGANLSLSIPHNVRNYACGRTPVCVECERLVDSGVTVVAAAGNRGYHNFATAEGSYEGYAAFSITDPGNADGVITVGSTHRYWPHTYGVSFFSSRGPTGDGRLKPDLVAPGERISAPVLDNKWGQMDGTSMAAPHVSGAAAMLMARYSEMIGQPRRIKRILCENATDLGRERTFQGAGMLDILRAFQSI